MDVARLYRRFPNRDSCITYLEGIHWRGRPRCPYCGSYQSTPAPAERRYHCNRCNRSFSVTVGTVFHKARVELQKWFMAIYLLGRRPSISGRELAKELDVDKNTAWNMASKIRGGMNSDPDLFRDIFETVEIYVRSNKERAV